MHRIRFSIFLTVLALAVVDLAAQAPTVGAASAARVSIADVRVQERDSGKRKVVLKVKRSGKLGMRSVVRFATANGTAKAGSDYIRSRGTVVFTRGQRSRTVAVFVRGDLVDEPNETFTVRLSRARGARIVRAAAKVTVVDDDAAPIINRAPVASAGADVVVNVIGTLQLDGSASSDADGNSITHAWTLVSKPAASGVVLTDATSAHPGLAPDKPGEYVVRLVVNDGALDSVADEVTVTAVSQVVRFAVIGAQGKGNQGQLDVAAAIDARCESEGCDYVIGVGNNIYDNGASSTSDPEFAAKFATPYANINLPFWLGLGNHDYGASGAGTDFPRALNEIGYSGVDSKWNMPSHHYHRVDEHVEFFTLDTNGEWLTNPATTSQGADVDGWLASSTAYWKLAFGLHSYRSNGEHGNAGEYDGQLPFVFAAGARVRDFIEDRVCGKAHAYFSGFDHTLQWPQQDAADCPGTELIVSGAAATATTLDEPPGYPTHFQAAVLGFAYVVIRDRTMTVEFIATDGSSLFTRSVTR